MQVNPDNRAQQVPQVLLVVLALQDLLVHQGTLAFWELLENQDSVETVERLGQMVHQADMVNLDPPDRMDNRENVEALDYLDHKEQVALPDHKEREEPQDTPVPKENQAQ